MKKQAQAQAFIEFVNDRIESSHLVKIDEMEPWLWHERDPWNATTVDDDGEDYSAIFKDGSRARWTNNDREWTLEEVNR